MKLLSNLMASVMRGLSSQNIQDQLIKLLETKAVTFLLKKFVISGGLKGWLIGFVVGQLVDKADEKLIEPAFRKVGWVADTLEGKSIYKRKINAENRDDWRDTVRNS